MNPNNPYPPQSPSPTPAPYQPPAAPTNYSPMQTPYPYTPPSAGSVVPPSATPYEAPYSPIRPGAPQGPTLPQPAPPPPSYTPPPRPKRYDKLPLPIRLAEWAKKNWWAPLIGIIILGLVGQVIYQMTFPANALPPGTMVDGQNVGRMDRDEAVKALDKAYGDIKTSVYFGSSSVPYRTPQARELGISVDNSKRLADVSYPVWLRLIPTSIMWASSLQNIEPPLYNYDTTTTDRFVLRQLGADCTIKPQNATIKLDDEQFAVVKSMPGGKCDVIDFKRKVAQTKLKNGKMTIRTDMSEVPAAISDDMAKELADTLNTNLKDAATMKAADVAQEVPARTLKGWLTFEAVIPEASEGEDGIVPPAKLTYAIDSERVRSYFDKTIASKLEKKPGTTKISTTDYTETARSNGEPGVMIDMPQAVAGITKVAAGETKEFSVVTGPVPATEAYTRTYTPSETGMSALIEQFAHDNKGRIGIYMQEESGKKPMLSGAVNAQEIFPAAGIEGLYVGYAAQVGIEDGSIQSTDKISGSLSVEDCITEAIKSQNRDCIEALLGKVTTPVAVQRLKAIGLNNTAFSGNTNTTTAQDAYTFMQKFRSKGLAINKKGAIETPMRDIELRDGMISHFGGQSSVLVMAGSEGASYNEAAHVANKGVYQISILTEGAEGAKTTKKLIQAIEKLRSERQALKSR